MKTDHDRRVSPLKSRSTTAGSTLEEYKLFLASALRDPHMLGAPAPTSRVVAAAVSQVVPTTGSPIIAELGPGTGTLSQGIAGRLPAGARHIAIELNESLVEHLQVHKPWLEVIHGDANDLVSLLDKQGISQVDAVVSSIPWSLLPDEMQDHMLRQVTEVLAPHGAFTALSYITAQPRVGAKRFRVHLEDKFDEVITHTTWANFPPLLNFICRRPLR